MGIEIQAMTCGWLTMSAKLMIEGGEGKLTVPIPSYLIRHPKGNVLFDTGLNKQVQTDPVGRLGDLTKYYGIDFHPGQDVKAQLEKLGVEPKDITYLVNSHLHFDHCGGNDQIDCCPMVVQKAEWAAATDPDMAAKIGFEAKDFDHGHDRIIADGEHDLFGDGGVVCIPTPGHTPGHQSLRVKLDSGEIVLTGDACYLRQTLAEMKLPRILFNAEQMLESLRKLKALQDRGARIFYGHDPEFWKTVPQAPEAIR
ncbi:MAG: N-acyl homoserine lactonase family protein [Minwuia sp.]|uniref:N-acyl homoserine lactonase family protein n=1 Tax=Minwuia sp. TaxID=2493630 RepID=UPI003A8447D3